MGLHAVRSGRACGLVRWLSGVTHSNEFQGDSPYKIGVVGCARSVMVVVLCFAAVLVSRVLGACVLCSSSYTYSGPHRHQTRPKRQEHRTPAGSNHLKAQALRAKGIWVPPQFFLTLFPLALASCPLPLIPPFLSRLSPLASSLPSLVSRLLSFASSLSSPLSLVSHPPTLHSGHICNVWVYIPSRI